MFHSKAPSSHGKCHRESKVFDQFALNIHDQLFQPSATAGNLLKPFKKRTRRFSFNPRIFQQRAVPVGFWKSTNLKTVAP